MNSREDHEQALNERTCGIHCRRAGRSAPDRRATSHLQKNAADGDEGFDAAVETSVPPRREDGVLREGRVYVEAQHSQRLLNQSRSTI